MELRQPNVLIEIPFSFPLAETLPSTFLYCGEHMSWLSVEYWLDVKFLGLTSTAMGVPNAALLQQRIEQVLVRAAEPPVRPRLIEEAKGTLKGALGKQKGEARIVATMPINTSMQNSPLKLKIDIDNRYS
jgi:hypothetical protein